MDNTQLLTILADGDFHSGREIGALLAVSRTAVWKQLQKLETLGLSIESVKGKGYRVPGGFELLDRSRILEALDRSVSQCVTDLTVFEVIDSTNDYLMELGKSKSCCGQVCLAEVQSKGKGRRGRKWISGFGSSICLSIGWIFESGVLSIEGLSLAIGVAVARALDKVGIKDTQLKWPNDILYEGKKLAGVLIELSGDAAGPCELVVGVGLNVNITSTDAARIDQSWIDINSIAESAISRNHLASLLVSELMLVISKFHHDTFSAYKDSWQELDAFKGKTVQLIQGGSTITGVANGVSDTGALCVCVDGVNRYFNGGEVSLRRAP